jgi:hypothetical protein
MRLSILLDRRIWRNTIAVLIAERNHHGEIIAYAEPMQLTKLTPEQRGGDELRETMNLHDEEAQQLLDELWRIGIRPSNGEGSVGQLAATERHLADMRTLVFTPPPKDGSQ